MGGISLPARLLTLNPSHKKPPEGGFSNMAVG
jgi:hypothetical protein